MCNLCYFCFAFSFILTSFLTRLCCQCMPACALPIECLISHFIYCPGILTCWLTWKGIVKAVVFDITATAYTSVASKATYTLPHGSSWGRSLWEHAEFELFQHWWVRQTYLRTHKHCKGAHVWHFLFSAPELAAEISLNPVLVLSWPFKMFLVFLHHSLCNNRQVQVGTPARMKIFLFFFHFFACHLIFLEGWWHEHNLNSLMSQWVWGRCQKLLFLFVVAYLTGVVPAQTCCK